MIHFVYFTLFFLQVSVFLPVFAPYNKGTFVILGVRN